MPFHISFYFIHGIVFQPNCKCFEGLDHARNLTQEKSDLPDQNSCCDPWSFVSGAGFLDYVKSLQSLKCLSYNSQ